MEYRQDKESRTVSIPVKVVGGEIRFLYDGARLPLAEGFVGDLIVPAIGLTDPEMLKQLESETTVQVLPAFSVVLLGMGGQHVPEAYWRDVFVVHRPLSAAPLAFTPVVLLEPLMLRLRGTKSAQLMGGPCWVPQLHRQADSLNHAYTMLSAVLEPERSSHTGNVFDRAYCHEADQWQELDVLRKRHEAQREQEIFMGNAAKPEPHSTPIQSTLDLSVAENPSDSRQREQEILPDLIKAHGTEQANHVEIDAAITAFIASQYSLETLHSQLMDGPIGR